MKLTALFETESQPGCIGQDMADEILASIKLSYPTAKIRELKNPGKSSFLLRMDIHVDAHKIRLDVKSSTPTTVFVQGFLKGATITGDRKSPSANAADVAAASIKILDALIAAVTKHTKAS